MSTGKEAAVMPKEFEVRWSGDLPGTPAQIWDAITVHSAGWLWPIEYEPRAGGAEKGLTGTGGTVTVWEPERWFVTRAPGNELDYRISGTHVDYTHRGTLDEADYDRELDACRRHTAFYRHTMAEYLRHFPGRDARYAAYEYPGDFSSLLAALEPAGVVDYRTATFLGVRTEDALYRFFGRDAWGWPVGATWHGFGAAKPAAWFSKHLEVA
jgi:hypothetical protein